jgi:regulatory protein
MLEMVAKAILNYCKYQERCHSEVRNKLYELGCTTTDVEQHLTKLIEIDALNEERFAKAFAGGKFRMKQWGREKIKQQLKLRKISDYCIRKAMTEIDPDTYERTMRKLAEKKVHENRSDRSVLSRKSKLYRYMVQKGYERDLVMDLVKDLI